jgi:hypothetical protein
MYLHPPIPPKMKTKRNFFFSSLPSIIHYQFLMPFNGHNLRGWKFKPGLTCRFNGRQFHSNGSTFFDPVILASRLGLQTLGEG